ncbi:hypothetical protein FD754_015425 [Muntiacus muntjak]|uniref:Uncharacterized protein n=1 Tax=Muntiacus muntjak TaxID=9888 RepID=A0A5N3VND9_MUNMU|nr:hypothetical protein FD754_015425 [Muntiacus muntjak]
MVVLRKLPHPPPRVFHMAPLAEKLRPKDYSCFPRDEMVKSVKKVAGMDVELTVEGRNLLSVASWRIISNKEENKGGEGKLKMIWEYRQMTCRVMVKSRIKKHCRMWKMIISDT